MYDNNTNLARYDSREDLNYTTENIKEAIINNIFNNKWKYEEWKL